MNEEQRKLLAERVDDLMEYLDQKNYGFRESIEVLYKACSNFKNPFLKDGE
jgi:hypothetical protein